MMSDGMARKGSSGFDDHTDHAWIGLFSRIYMIPLLFLVLAWT